MSQRQQDPDVSTSSSYSSSMYDAAKLTPSAIITEAMIVNLAFCNTSLVFVFSPISNDNSE